MGQHLEPVRISGGTLDRDTFTGRYHLIMQAINKDTLDRATWEPHDWADL